MASTTELTTSGMMSLARLQMAPLSPTSLYTSSRDAKGTIAMEPPEGRVDFDAPHKDDEDVVDYMGMLMKKGDLSTVRHFEECWGRFVQRKAARNELPKGRREEVIEDFQEKIRAIQHQKENVDGEFIQKIAMYKKSTADLVLDYSRDIAQAKTKADKVQKEWTERLETAQEANELQQDTLPWFHFLRQVDLEAKLFDLSSWKEEETKHETAHPSDRALFLAAARANEDSTKDETMVHAHQIDHALLTSHVDMLKMEIERFEKMVASQEIAGRFLALHDTNNIVSPDDRNKFASYGYEKEGNSDDESFEETGPLDPPSIDSPKEGDDDVKSPANRPQKEALSHKRRQFLDP